MATKTRTDRAKLADDRAGAPCDEEELALIVDEITQAMGGRSTVLTLHPSSGQGAALVCTDRRHDADTTEHVLSAATKFIAGKKDDTPVWRPGLAELGDETLLIPVASIEGHSRLVLTIFFDETTPLSRRRAESVYFARRPFAVGYFRLWQLERTRRRQAKALQAALDLAEIGVLMLDRDGRITFANAAGEHILSKNDSLRRVGGSLRTISMADGVRLQVAINDATSIEGESRTTRAGTAAIVAISRPSAPPLMVSVLASAEEPVEPGDVAAIVFVVDPRLDTARMLEPICRLYRLSPVETRLVSCLAQGKTLADAANAMRVKELTARSYMKQIFAKTSTNRQNELIVLMLSSVVRMRTGLVQTALGGAS